MSESDHPFLIQNKREPAAYYGAWQRYGKKNSVVLPAEVIGDDSKARKDKLVEEVQPIADGSHKNHCFVLEEGIEPAVWVDQNKAH